MSLLHIRIQPAFLSYLEPLLADGKVRELDVRELNRMLKDLTYTASLGLFNGTGLPLAAHGQVIGVIFIFRNYPDLFTTNDRSCYRLLPTRQPWRFITQNYMDR